MNTHSKSSVLPEWNGNPKSLPEQGKQFVYKGKRYTWQPCPCCNPFCKRPLAYDEKGHEDEAMSYRLRGDDTGNSRINLLLKLGHTPEEMAAADGDTINDLVDSFVGEILSSENEEEFFKKKGVKKEEVNEAALEVVESESTLEGTILARLFRATRSSS